VALALASLLLASSGRRAAEVLAAAALAGAAALGPIALAREARHRVTLVRRIRQAQERPSSPEEIAARAAARLPEEISRIGARFAGAEEQDLTDIAFALWKGCGLAAAAPVSGIRLWHEGRVVSRFAFGIPSESKDVVAVGGEVVRLAHRRVSFASPGGLAAGESPDEADVEVGEWPSWRPLPSPLAEYRKLLDGDSGRGEGEEPPPEESFSEKLLEAFAASTAVLAVVLALAAGAATVRWARSGRGGLRLRPATFRGRITALFTILVLAPFLAAAVFIRATVATRLRRETVLHAQTALTTARTVLDDYLSAAGSSAGRRELIDDELLSWMARVVGHDLSIYTDGTVDSTSRRELFASDLLSERLSGASLRRIIVSNGGPVVESKLLEGKTFDQVEAALTSLPGRASLAGPAVLSIPLLPQQRETEQEVARLSATLTAFTLLVFGVSLLLGTRTAYRVTGPIGDLVEGTHAVVRGETPRVPVPADTELKRLVEDFLSMAATLEAQREDLARANRLRAWAEMARIIAHEVKNPLTPIRLSAEHLLEVWRRGDPDFGRALEECVRNILLQTQTLGTIASEFSDYARLPEPERREVDASALVDSAIASFAAAPGIRWDKRVDVATVSADPKLLARALANLVGNAVEALRGQGGRISVSARRMGPRVVFRVEDDGPGVPESALPRLFEPYFSTKSAGGGLGLAIVRRIAQEHGGDARAERLSPRGFAVEFEVGDPKEV
jgi:signal transduction histidine kinase